MMLVVYEERTYRTRMGRQALTRFRVVLKETDLMILAARDLSDAAFRAVARLRLQLESYIGKHSEFVKTLRPWPDDPFAPPVVRDMIAAARPPGVGPMAAVAGAIAERVGRELLPDSPEIIVENGGDIFLVVQTPATVALYAGNSPLSWRVGITIAPEATPLGLCTSSGTVGHSFSLGKADAACVLGDTAALADAAATALGNQVAGPDDINPALEWLTEVPGVRGAVIIVGDKLGAWGQVELTPLER